MAPAIYLETYGCQMNFADTEMILGHVGDSGYVRTVDPTLADVILLNTCAIREHAEERVIGRLTDLARLKAARPGMVLGMAGCMAQHHRSAVTRRVPMLDFVVGPDAYRRLPALLDVIRSARTRTTDFRAAADDDPNSTPAQRGARIATDVRLDPSEDYADLRSARTPGAVRAWVTVIRGCDKFCTFCVVPYVRGRERSLPVDAVLRQVRAAVADGASEVVFLGQTVNAYRDGACDFAELLQRAAATPGLARLRFTSPHPADVTPALIDVMRDVPVIAPQLHLPVQSGSDAVLARMARGYTVAAFRDLVARVRDTVPDVALSTDVIVGFPGETGADYDATYRLLEELRFDQAYLYKYSPRSLTRAATWEDSVPDAEKSRRLSAVIALQERIAAERNRAWIGRSVEVLVEGPARRPAGHVAGKTPQYTTAVVNGDAAPGTIVRGTVIAATGHTLIASADAPAAALDLAG
ncbi:MAG: tRNA (N6-isopentenyl adenosine(37)-C2)-methylthiotransferase MiaB [Polyangiaceae bacterium UTPRO1]|nr:tRNA (N6-isopentenyl adenosine(37)-C2)-methylthiotransferase MiaB [Myxococcales bacterium]OQY64831.1 MAG: tRNA (N6-isopentenyl adenosine(37)-C2)-methylthiotransferase MiaB [Polyangiaceae bacterium UTPRO1]